MSDSRVVPFEINREFLSSRSGTGVEIGAEGDASAIKAIADNTPFPVRQIDAGSIFVQGEAGKNIIFDNAGKEAAFKNGISGSAHAGLGVYREPDELVKAILPGEKISEILNLTHDDDRMFTLLKWGYDLEASAEGSVALSGPAKVTFGADGSREHMFAVIRSMDKNMGAFDAVKETVNSWLLPLQVQSEENLQPGTWLISEVESEISLKLDGQYGFDFNWVKQSGAGDLSGDIGLKLQLGVQLGMGFEAAGKFALVVARESADPQDKRLRLRLFKQRKKGWNFALRSGATAESSFSDFAENFDELIKAVFGIQGEQVIKHLKTLEEWTDPNQDITDLFDGLDNNYLKSFLHNVTGIDPESAFNEAKEKVQEFLEMWDELDHEASTRLWKLVEDHADLEPVRDLVNKIAELDEEAGKKYLNKLISDVDFFKTPAGKFLVSLVPQGTLFTALTQSDLFASLQEKAHQVSEILDGSAVEELFKKLAENIEKRLKLDKVRELTNQADFDDLDEWLKSKLAEFLGEKTETLNFEKVKEIQKTIHLLLEKRETFYKASLKALNRKVDTSFNSAYQKTQTGDALLDITFDFEKGDPGEFLKDALRGKFDRILIEKHPAVTLNLGALSHGIEQNSSVEINLPFFKSTVKHINHSLSKMEAIDEDEGRILVYELGAKDTVLRKNHRASTLAIGGNYKSKTNRVRLHSAGSLTYSYTFRQARKNMKRADLQYQLKPYISKYFPSAFSAPYNGGYSAPFDTWLSDLDKTIDKKENNGTDNLGHVLFSLEVNVPTRIASAWLKAPADKKDGKYMDMSRAVQAKLKELIPFYFFSNPDHFKNILPAYFLLGYASVPPSTTIDVSYGNLRRLSTDKKVYWDWVDQEKRAMMLKNSMTESTLTRYLQNIHNRLLSTPGAEYLADSYKPESAANILTDVISSKHSESVLRSLFFVESTIVKAASKAGLTMAEFVQKADSKPAEAVKILSEFGSEITRAFNKKFTSVYGKDALRPLGSLIFIEAAMAFDPGLYDSETHSMLDLSVLKQSTEFDFNRFLDKNTLPEGEDILFQERFIE